MSIRQRIAAAIMIAGLCGPAGATTLLVNGSFELDDGRNGAQFTGLATPGGASWRIFNSLPGWTLASGGGIEVQTNRTLGAIDAQDGQYYLEADSSNNSTISQSVFLSVGRYEFSFWYAPRTNRADSNDVTYEVSGLGQIELTGTVAGPSGPFPRLTWTEVMGQFIVTQAGSYTVSLGGAGRSDGVGGLVDNVSLQAVPLPPAGLLFLGGLAGVLGLRRRQI